MYFIYNNKQVFYEEIGTGEPLILLHGNSVSSKMFNSIIDLYKDDYKLILIDFLGHGESERVDVFTTDFWYDQGLQVIELCETNGYKNVNLIGTSGGAIAAINVALERPDLISKVIADSFEGESSIEEFAGTVVDERLHAKADEGAIQFWRYMHGDDWRMVVDQDTDVVIKHHKEIKDFFHKDISKLKVAMLMTGTTKDEYISKISDIYNELDKKIHDCSIHVFEEGGHPSMMTSAEAFAVIAKTFLQK
jgi:pimeloyl-ACP methyl ester carboxylesterase